MILFKKFIFKTGTRVFQNENGQSAIEYLVICSALITLVLISSSQNSIYNMMSHTIHDKYSSYAFGVSISDPPSKAFDDAVKHDAAKVKEVLGELADVEKFIKNISLPDINNDDLPSIDKVIIKDLKALWNKIKDL